MILMTEIWFGGAGTQNVGEFGISPPISNYLEAGAIQEKEDVEGPVSTLVTVGAAATNALMGVAVVTDLLIPDPACAANISCAWVPLGAMCTIDVTWDGLAKPPGDISIVRCVWKGVDILIFMNFPP